LEEENNHQGEEQFHKFLFLRLDFHNRRKECNKAQEVVEVEDILLLEEEVDTPF